MTHSVYRANYQNATTKKVHVRLNSKSKETSELMIRQIKSIVCNTAAQLFIAGNHSQLLRIYRLWCTRPFFLFLSIAVDFAMQNSNASLIRNELKNFIQSGFAFRTSPDDLSCLRFPSSHPPQLITSERNRLIRYAKLQSQSPGCQTALWNIAKNFARQIMPYL